MTATNLHFVTLLGSLRKASFNGGVARALPALAPEGATIAALGSVGEFPLYNADVQEGSGFPAPANELAAAIKAADGVLFVTPEYNWSMPGVLKNAIDWVSRLPDQPFKEKPVAIQSCSQGPLGGARMQYHWRMSMTFLNAFIFGTPEVFVGLAQNKFDKDTLALTDQPTKDVIKTQLAVFAKFIARMKR